MSASKMLSFLIKYITALACLLCAIEAAAQSVPVSGPVVVIEMFCDTAAHKDERCCKLPPAERAKDPICRLNQ